LKIGTQKDSPWRRVNAAGVMAHVWNKEFNTIFSCFKVAFVYYNYSESINGFSLKTAFTAFM
jgi:hypothetical protein